MELKTKGSKPCIGKSSLWWFAVIGAILFFVTILVGCSSSRRLSEMDGKITSAIGYLHQKARVDGGLHDSDMKIMSMLSAAQAALPDIRRAIDAESGLVDTAFDIGAVFAGPYAPLITMVGGIFGIGGVAQARRKKKQHDEVQADMKSLASTLVRVADSGEGVIDTNDELTRARLSAMSPGASVAIREAKGKV